jgi:hypothetical protein
MKNITLNFVFLMTLFTFIGCDNLPIQPEIDDSTNYSIAPNTLNGEETMIEVVTQSNGFIVNKNVVPLDSILPCLNLSQDQWDIIKKNQVYWMRIYYYTLSQWKQDLQFLDIITQQNFKKLNIKTSDTNYRKVMMEFNRTYKLKKDSIDKMMSDSLSKNQKHFYTREVGSYLYGDQRVMFYKWYNNQKLTCEFLKP